MPGAPVPARLPRPGVMRNGPQSEHSQAVGLGDGQEFGSGLQDWGPLQFVDVGVVEVRGPPDGERLDPGVLPRGTRVDEDGVDAVAPAPVGHGGSDELGAERPAEADFEVRAEVGGRERRPSGCRIDSRPGCVPKVRPDRNRRRPEIIASPRPSQTLAGRSAVWHRGTLLSAGEERPRGDERVDRRGLRDLRFTQPIPLFGPSPSRALQVSRHEVAFCEVAAFAGRRVRRERDHAGKGDQAPHESRGPRSVVLRMPSVVALDGGDSRIRPPGRRERTRRTRLAAGWHFGVFLGHPAAGPRILATASRSASAPRAAPMR